MQNSAPKTANQIDRRVAEAEKSKNEAANVTLDSIGEAVLRTNIHGDIVFLNRMAEKMTGWSREEALGHPVSEVLRIIDGGTACTSAVESAMKEHETAGIKTNYSNCILVRRDGSECGIENIVTPVCDQTGNISGAVAAFHDVTAARARSLFNVDL